MAGSPISATAAQKGCRGMSSKHQRATDWVMPVWATVAPASARPAPGTISPSEAAPVAFRTSRRVRLGIVPQPPFRSEKPRPDTAASGGGNGNP